MEIIILTLFPDMFTPLDHSIIKRAREKNLVSIRIVNFRDWAAGKHKQVDDTPAGGGAGMVLMAQPIVDCIEELDPNREFHRIFLTPDAPTLKHDRVVQLASKNKLLMLAGHYKGVDQRAIDLCIDEKISIGEYVLTGGELAAMVLCDSIIRHVPNVLKPDSLAGETHTNKGHHEYPKYTNPREFRGMQIPPVLLSGNHAEIEKWKGGCGHV